jgi:hypothetical protein
MSELKVYVPQDGPYGLVPEEGGAPVGEETCYLKSEVDKLIAKINMNSRIADGDEDFGIANNQIERLLKIVRHQKYKRCLAMAKWCDAKADWYYGIGESLRNRVEFYIKWHKRWLELADAFKEVVNAR